MLISPSEGPTTVYLRYEFAALVRSKIPTKGCSTTWDKQGAALTRTPDGLREILKCRDTKRRKWQRHGIAGRDTPWVLASLKQAPPP